ncbi:uncharacterized protein LOC133818890 [Humulus lupulus]|uniref:uncharacterized protein LOC133818890 n=1 Tax=Humulus lupulus TaxID=3486 RepID=UPI002B40839E|nr:uncharacterized protein LOC133818890 [Humulus lupulus]
MEFGNVQLLRLALKEHFIHTDREYMFTANDAQKLRAKCKVAGCPWVVHAYVKENGITFRVNTFLDTHRCGIVLNNRHIDAQWLAKHFIDQFRLHPNMDYSAFKEMTHNTNYSMVSASQFYRACSTAKEELEVSVVQQFAILEDYCKQILNTKPGSTAKIQTELRDEKRIFKRVYICLKTYKDSFLQGYCKGILLGAIGIAETNSIFPIAYAIVKKETTMISDKQNGLQNAVEALFQGLDSRFCVRHMHGNFKKDFSGHLLKQFLWAVARATTPAKFDQKMKDLKDVNEGAYNWLAAKEPSEGSRACFKGVKCDMLLIMFVKASTTQS